MKQGETLQIRSVDPALALGFKHAALDQRMTHAELFEHIFTFWEEHRKEEKEERKERKEREKLGVGLAPRGRSGGAAVPERIDRSEGLRDGKRPQTQKKSGRTPSKRVPINPKHRRTEGTDGKAR
jgi:hypothetical protein